MVCDCEEEITVVRLLSNGCYYSVFLLAVLWVDEWSVSEEEITVVRLLSNGCYYSVFFLAVLWVDEWSVIVKKR